MHVVCSGQREVVVDHRLDSQVHASSLYTNVRGRDSKASDELNLKSVTDSELATNAKTGEHTNLTQISSIVP